jgi:hypothetical protein
MRRTCSAAVCLAAMLVLMSSVAAQAQTQAVITGAFTTSTSVSVTGTGFGSVKPTASLGGVTLNVRAWTSTSLTADLPQPAPTSGAYQLAVIRASAFKDTDLSTRTGMFSLTFGAVGPAGPPGPMGLQGAPGPVGPQGAPGAVGPAGASGPQGPTGAAGAAGPKGDTGAPGPQGTAGVVGPVGPVGPIGPQGLAGPVGPAGPAGVTGAAGATGAVGPGGPMGADGAPGPQGPQGAIGPVGPRGEAGLTGSAGPEGAKGDAGPQGLAGATGPQGGTGPAGGAGPQGPAGIQGPIGPTGPQGADGIKGDRGLRWRGPWAASIVYVVDDAVEFQGSSYVASIANADATFVSANWQTLAGRGLTGPVGPSGATGVDGLPGLQGPQGPSGSAGAAGPRGPSDAYHVGNMTATVNFTTAPTMVTSLNLPAGAYVLSAKLRAGTTGAQTWVSCELAGDHQRLDVAAAPLFAGFFAPGSYAMLPLQGVVSSSSPLVAEIDCQIGTGVGFAEFFSITAIKVEALH